eukprot:564986-Hanusia_phi.AAC.5
MQLRVGASLSWSSLHCRPAVPSYGRESGFASPAVKQSGLTAGDLQMTMTRYSSSPQGCSTPRDRRRRSDWPRPAAASRRAGRSRPAPRLYPGVPARPGPRG